MADDGLGISLFTSAGILLFLAIVTTTLRCLTRTFIVKNFGLDDWLMIATVILYTHYCAWIFYGRSLDQGRKNNEIRPDYITPALRSFYFAENSYILTTLTLKLSIGTFLLRIVKKKLQVWLIYGLITIMTVFCITLFFLSVFQCRPVQRFWIPTLPGSCNSQGMTLATSYTHAAIIASSDFFFAILPIFVIWDLRMDRFTKISVCGLMGLGGIAGITTIARVPYIKALTDENDFLHATAELAILSSVEPGLGIIIGSAAATRPLFRSLIKKYQSHYTPSNPTSNPTVSTHINSAVRGSFFPAHKYHHHLHAGRDGSRDREREGDIEMQISSSDEDVYRQKRGVGFGSVMVTTGEKGLCERCRQVGDLRTGGCGCFISVSTGEGSYLHAHSRDGSQEVLTPPQRVVYRDVDCERVVEFLGRGK